MRIYGQDDLPAEGSPEGRDGLNFLLGSGTYPSHYNTPRRQPRALVTGDRGFVGRHMHKKLMEEGYSVRGIDLKLGEDALDFFRDSNESFDLIVHCAYHVGGRESIDGLNMNLALNLQLDAAMFQYALRTGSSRVLYFSSSAAYPVRLQTGKPQVPLLETDLMHSSGMSMTPDAGYGWAKQTGEHMAEQARKMGLDVHVVRPMSGYGEDQDLCYPFPAIVRRAMYGDFTVWGPKEQTRDWIHIDDIVDACMAIIDADYQKPVNLATGIGTTMGDLLKLARFLYDQRVVKTEEIFFDESKPTGVLYRVGSPMGLWNIYRPKVTLNQGVLRAIEAIERTEG